MSDFATKLPRNLYRAAQVRELDRVAIEDFGIPGFKLMQTAAAVAFTQLMENWPQLRRLQVFVGSGNNAGDGYIVAGLAQDAGLEVTLIAIADPTALKGDAKTAWLWAQEKGLASVTFDEFLSGQITDSLHTVVLDALLGTGLDREVAGAYLEAIEFINAQDYPVLAVDIPSGLQADTGAVLGAAVRADLTVTFIGMKQGLLTNRGRDYVGTVVYSDLDVPKEVFAAESVTPASAQRIDVNSATPLLVSRSKSSHKGSHGHVLIIGGDYSFGGAVIMAAEAALRSGAGLVSVITRSCHRAAMLARRPEVMVLGTEDSTSLDELIARASVIVIGPGLGRGAWSQNLLALALAAQLNKNIPLVVDADGLNLLAERRETGAGIKRDNWILTPHPGEAANLLGCSIAELQADRFHAVSRLQEEWGGCCLLKGSGSVIACPSVSTSDINLYLCSEGNAGMASAGMGDVLSGIIGGLLAQGLSLRDSLCAGVALHGEAADLAAQADGQRGLVATDLLPYLRQLLNPSF